jgi:hypothetical protein
MDPSQIGMIVGIIGGVVGSLIGIAGGLVGCYIPYRNAKTPREKAFVLRGALFFWVLVLFFLAGLWLLPAPWNWLIWIPYGVVLVGSILWFNQQQRKIIAEEANSSSSLP